MTSSCSPIASSPPSVTGGTGILTTSRRTAISVRIGRIEANNVLQLDARERRGERHYCVGCEQIVGGDVMQWTDDGQWLCRDCRRIVCEHDGDIRSFCVKCRVAYGRHRPNGRRRADWRRGNLVTTI